MMFDVLSNPLEEVPLWMKVSAKDTPQRAISIRVQRQSGGHQPVFRRIGSEVVIAPGKTGVVGQPRVVESIAPQTYQLSSSRVQTVANHERAGIIEEMTMRISAGLPHPRYNELLADANAATESQGDAKVSPFRWAIAMARDAFKL